VAAPIFNLRSQPMPDTRTDQQKIDNETCKIHQTPMVKVRQHVGHGASEWSKPACPLCDELKANGKYDEAVASIKADKADMASIRPGGALEQPAPSTIDGE
jgi:hypothetical protein